MKLISYNNSRFLINENGKGGSVQYIRIFNDVGNYIELTFYDFYFNKKEIDFKVDKITTVRKLNFKKDIFLYKEEKGTILYLRDKFIDFKYTTEKIEDNKRLDFIIKYTTNLFKEEQKDIIIIDNKKIQEIVNDEYFPIYDECLRLKKYLSFSNKQDFYNDIKKIEQEVKKLWNVNVKLKEIKEKEFDNIISKFNNK